MTKPDLTTAVGVEAELVESKADFELGKKILLAAWQRRRKRLRALLAVLEDYDAAPDPEKDTAE